MVFRNVAFILFPNFGIDFHGLLHYIWYVGVVLCNALVLFVAHPHRFARADFSFASAVIFSKFCFD